MTGGVENTESGELLKSFFERLMRLEEQKDEILEDQRDVYKELKSEGFEPAIMRKVIQRAKKDPEMVREVDAILETYEAVTETGSGHVGILTTRRGDDGRFEVHMAKGPAAANGRKMNLKEKQRRDAMNLAELSRMARGE